MGWTVLPHPAHSPDLAPSDYHLFSPVKDALHGRHMAGDNELTQSFCDLLQVKAGNFTTVQCLTQVLAKVCGK
jgi:histone-lysine N-methyltransferase SETMAR